MSAFRRLVIDDIALDLAAIVAFLGFLDFPETGSNVPSEVGAAFPVSVGVPNRFRVSCLTEHARPAPALICSATYRTCA